MTERAGGQLALSFPRSGEDGPWTGSWSAGSAAGSHGVRVLVRRPVPGGSVSYGATATTLEDAVALLLRGLVAGDDTVELREELARLVGET